MLRQFVEILAHAPLPDVLVHPDLADKKSLGFGLSNSNARVIGFGRASRSGSWRQPAATHGRPGGTAGTKSRAAAGEAQHSQASKRGSIGHAPAAAQPLEALASETNTDSRKGADISQTLTGVGDERRTHLKRKNVTEES